jgi:hypothetical protein
MVEHVKKSINVSASSKHSRAAKIMRNEHELFKYIHQLSNIDFGTIAISEDCATRLIGTLDTVCDHILTATVDDETMSDKERALLQLCKDELVKTLTQMKDEIDFPVEPEDEQQRIVKTYFQITCIRNATSLLVNGLCLGLFMPPLGFNIVKESILHGALLSKRAAAKKRPTIELRKQILKENYKPEDLVDSTKFADSILNDVNTELDKIGIKKVSSRTIRRDIEAILEERRKIEGHS